MHYIMHLIIIIVHNRNFDAGVVGAENGTLTFMVGGDESTLTEAEHLLSCMGSRWVYCGPAGSGLVAKICNNMILGMTMAALSEAMNLGIKYVSTVFINYLFLDYY